MTERLKTSDQDRAIMEAGVRARTILEDGLFREVVDKLDAAIIEAWKTGDTREAREAAHARFLAMRSILVELQSLFQQGELARELAAKHDANSTATRGR